MSITQFMESIDNYVVRVGMVGTAIFCFFLSVLIFRARRDVKSDRWLSRVLFLWGVIAVYSLVRRSINELVTPYIATLLWAASLIAVLFATASLLEEIAVTNAMKRAEAEALSAMRVLKPTAERVEAAAIRTEESAERIEHAVEKEISHG